MFSFRSIVFSSLPAHKFVEIAAELLGIDHHELRVRHLRDAVDAGLRKIVLDEADIAPAVLLLLVAVPVGDLRADLCGRLWQNIVVPRPENVADGLIRVGL